MKEPQLMKEPQPVKVTRNSACLDTPIGRLRVLADGNALLSIEFEHQHDGSTAGDSADPVLQASMRQLEQYFDGRRRQFELPLAAAGTEFQQAVWRALREIPFGEVRSYRQIARSIGRDSAVRAVGAANGRNPLPVVVPCHRVIGSDGSLTGFAGGLAAKQALLELEGALPD